MLRSGFHDTNNCRIQAVLMAFSCVNQASVITLSRQRGFQALFIRIALPWPSIVYGDGETSRSLSRVIDVAAPEKSSGIKS
jgi:hypothetical protein